MESLYCQAEVCCATLNDFEDQSCMPWLSPLAVRTIVQVSAVLRRRTSIVRLNMKGAYVAGGQLAPLLKPLTR